MNLKSCERKEKSVAELIVETNKEEFDAAINEAFKKNKNRISVPGFRKGKAPRKIIEKMYGASIFYNDAMDIILPKVLSFAVEETGIKIVSYPQVEDVEINEDGAGAVFTISVSVYPDVKLGEYKGITAVKQSVEVPESAIDSELASTQLRNARIEVTTRPAINGDTATIDFEGFIDGETFEGGKGTDYELELGSGTFIPGFEEKLHGMTIGEEREIDLVFPENYEESLAGREVVFKVKLKELKEKILPELDDEFAKDVSEFDTIEEYKADIRARLEKARRKDVENAFENELIKKITDAMECDIPDVMIEEHQDNAVYSLVSRLASYGMDEKMYFNMMGTTEADYRESIRDDSVRQVKTLLALSEIVKQENIEVSEEEIDTEYQEAAERYDIPIDEMEENFDRETIASNLRLRRAAKIIVENAIAEEESATNSGADE